MTTFNDLLTRTVMRLDAYRYVQDYIVPWEVRMVGVILYPFGFQPRVVGEYLAIGKGQPLLIEIAWNCIGWQSLVMFAASAVVMLQSGYGYFSKLKAILLGVVGTMLINTIRIALVILMFRFVGGGAATVFHNYGALFTNTAWLIGFWWFSYSFVLEEKVEHTRLNSDSVSD